MMTRAASSCVCLSLLTLAGVAGCARAASLTWLSPELRGIEVEQRALQSTLATLPPAPAPQVTERLGYHSSYSTSPDTLEWIELDLHQATAIEAVVLVPAASDGSSAMAPGYGFPVRFRVEIFGGADHADRTVIADCTRKDFANPGMLPVYLPARGRPARFVRITATKLFEKSGSALLALGEVLVLQGARNLAAHLPRSDIKSSSSRGAVPVWGVANLVDGHSALGLPEGMQPSPALGYRCQPVSIQREPQPQPRWVQVDLGAVLPVDEVRLFPAHPPEFAHRRGFAYPPGLKVELSEDAGLRNAVEVAGHDDPTSPGDNAVSFVARQESARYVRVTAPRLFDANGRYLFALAEMQVWSGNTNVALGQPVSAFDSTEEQGWSRAALVDGFTSRANILDWPEWLAGLSQRRETMQRLAVLDVQRVAVLAHFKTVGWWLLGGVVAAALLTMLGINLRQRRKRGLEMEALRQRIAQDLHDEIGSSLGSIAFISEDALTVTQDDTVRSELCEIRDTAQETLESMRDLVRLMQSDRYGDGDLTGTLRGIAGRMLRGIPHTYAAPAAAAFDRLPLDPRSELVFMFKEALHNLARHAQATQADITLAQDDGALTLTVRDNGCGFDAAALNGSGMGLANLQRRATRQGGSVRVVSAPAQGTTLTIALPAHV